MKTLLLLLAIFNLFEIRSITFTEDYTWQRIEDPEVRCSSKTAGDLARDWVLFGDWSPAAVEDRASGKEK